MKTNTAIPVNDITQLCDCLDNRFSVENSLAFDVNGVNSETKTKIRAFLKGFAYAHDGELNISENIYSITVKENNSYIHCKYSVKKLGTYENTVCTQTDLYLAADALVRGEKTIIDLSNAEDSVAFFQFLSGVAFALGAELDRKNQDTFIFTPKFIRIPEEQKDLKHVLVEKDLKHVLVDMNKTDDLVETDIDLTEAEQLESLYKEGIEILDKYRYLTPARLNYSNFLYRIGKADAALRELDTFCDFYVSSGNARCSHLFHEALSKALQSRLDMSGFEELNAFASKLIAKSTDASNDKSVNTALSILNTEAEILIKNENSSKAIKLLTKTSIEVTKCGLSVQVDYLFLNALAFYKIGKFRKAERILTDLLPKIESEGRTTINCLEVKRLLASVYAYRGQPAKATKLLKEVIDAVYLKSLEEYFIPFRDDSDASNIYLVDVAALDNE